MRRTRMLTVASTLVVAVLAAGLSACSTPARPPSITVFAAASLKPAFTEIAQRFDAENPGTTVAFNFGGSSELALQLTQGADADVFASANTAQMAKVSDAGLLAGEPVPFAANSLVIVTAPGNPEHVASFADLARPQLSVVICQQPVPCGAATHKVEENTHVRLAPVSEEPDVTDVLNKVTSGQADAGLVYRTDAISAGDAVTTVPFPEAAAAVNSYPIAALRDAPRSAAAQQFIDLVTGEVGRGILDKAGFARAGVARP